MDLGVIQVPTELLDGRMTARGHRRLVQSASEANFNMLRVPCLGTVV
jgi:hypothetical protein